MMFELQPTENTKRQRRRFYFLLFALLLIAVSVVCFAFWPRPLDPVLVAKFEHVEIGMTLDELTALIGKPSMVGHLATPLPNKPFAIAEWEVGETLLKVTMNDKWEVTTKTCGGTPIDRKFNELFRRLFP